MDGYSPTVFVFEGSDVRVIDRDGDPWFVAKDVAELLGYQEPGRAIRQHCKRGCEMHLPSSGGSQLTKIVPERDVYRLIIRSRLPAAERFEEWVVGEVLPTIRKTGGYSAQPFDMQSMVEQVFDRLVEKRIPELIDARLAQDPKVAGFSRVSALDLARQKKIIKRPRGLAQKISGCLTRFCEQRARSIRRDTRGVKLFDIADVDEWAAHGGWEEIDRYLSHKRGQGRLL